MSRRLSCPVPVRGITYPNPDAAAAALGVSRASVLEALRLGDLDTLGLRSAQIRRVQDRCPFEVRGQQFETFEACAEVFGITVTSVKQALRKGRADQIGLPAHKTRKRHGPAPMRARASGKDYESYKAAAQRLKVSETTVRTAVTRGREDFVGLGRSRKHRIKHGGPSQNAKPVQIGTQSWPSMCQCADDLGVPRNTLRDRLRKGDTEWLMAKAMSVISRRERQAYLATIGQERPYTRPRTAA